MDTLAAEMDGRATARPGVKVLWQLWVGTGL